MTSISHKSICWTPGARYVQQQPLLDIHVHGRGWDPAEKKARQQYFNIRVWGAGDLVKAIYCVYNKLLEEIQTDLPLKPVWMLVSEDDE